mgnify:CR=1 FL=1
MGPSPARIEPYGSAPTMMTFGLCSFRRLAAPEIVPPAELAAAGRYLPTCPPAAQQYISAIWTELNK